MATSVEFRDFILGQLDLCEEIFCRAMMGEYLLYSKGVLFGGIYNERLLFKITETNKKYNLDEAIPYKTERETAKPMYICKDLQNKELLRDIVVDTCLGVSYKKSKKK